MWRFSQYSFSVFRIPPNHCTGSPVVCIPSNVSDRAEFLPSVLPGRVLHSAPFPNYLASNVLSLRYSQHNSFYILPSLWLPTFRLRIISPTNRCYWKDCHEGFCPAFLWSHLLLWKMPCNLVLLHVNIGPYWKREVIKLSRRRTAYLGRMENMCPDIDAKISWRIFLSGNKICAQI